jgi:large subunit ribosomal protein L21
LTQFDSRRYDKSTPKEVTAINAVIRTGGKQYRVREGSVLEVATIAAEPGSRVELREVLMVTDEGKVSVGSPVILDAVVVAEVLAHGKGRKVVSFKFKAKTRYRRKRGHRQGFTRIAVREILTDGVQPAAAPAEAEAVTTPRRRVPRARQETEETSAAVEAQGSTESTETLAREEAAPVRRRRRAATEESAQE